MNTTWIIIGIVGVVLAYLWSLYNGLIGLKHQIEEAFSQIDVQMKRRADLIPNLVETVKGYAKHEKTVFAEVTKARSALVSAGHNLNKMAAASDMLTGALGKLFAVAEAYPELKANEGFVQLQKELSDTEDKVAYARQYYNNTVKEFNIRIQQIPASLIANHLGFTQKQYFEAAESERKSVKVDFS